VFRRPGLAVTPRFLWECLISPAVNPSPTPATSNGAGGFPALRSPACFTPRLMGPAAVAALWAVAHGHGLLHLVHATQPSPWRISSPSGLAARWVPLSSHPCLPCWWRNCRTAGLLRSTGITPLRRYYEPIRHPLVVSRFPGAAGYTAYPASAAFAAGRGGLLQLLAVFLSPCCR
jgi:hypothetical protein